MEVAEYSIVNLMVLWKLLSEVMESALTMCLYKEDILYSSVLVEMFSAVSM